MRSPAVVVRGDGPPLVLVPGVQGRWEYSRGLVEALAAQYRVVTFSLCDERGARAGAPPFDVFADQVAAAMDASGVECAPIVGVSFGGLVALRFAATRGPGRAAALAMISAPGPRWHLRPRHEFYARLPWLFGPIFLLESPWRLRREVLAALPGWSDRARYLREQARTVGTAPVSLARMAARGRLIGRYDRVSDARRITVPTLVLQGDPALDHVTGSGGTHEYAGLIPNAALVTMERTGHLGSVTRPAECAAIIHRFLVDATKDTRHSAA